MSNTNDSERGPHNVGSSRSHGIPARPPISIDLHQSESESDAVTELFLGEGSAVPSSMPSARSRPLAEPPAAWKVVGRTDDHDDHDDLEHAPKSSFDSVTPYTAPLATPMIEAIVQGHLPVFAAAWVTQYARARAEEMRSAVVLIRVRQGATSVECIFPSGTPAISMTPSDSVVAAISLAAGMGAKYWLIQTDEVSEPDLWQLEQINRITILTGADEAALVACYRALKGIAQTTNSESDASIHIAVLGATPEKAAHAIERVTRAGDNFLGRSVTGALAAAKIGAGTASSLFRSSTDITTLQEVVDAIATLPLSHSPVPPAPPAPPAPSRDQAVRQEMAAMRELLNSSASASHESQVEQDQNTSVPQSPANTRPASLIEFIDDIDAIALSCPTATGVEFGIAPDGRLHLVAHVDGELNGGHPSNQSRAVEDLFVAAAWATANARLLLYSNASIRLDDREHTPILHIITTKPREARRLLDTNIRVHLVLPPPEDQHWTSMELN